MSSVMDKRIKKKIFGAFVRNARAIGYKIGRNFPAAVQDPSVDIKIDVAIPCVSKDFDILPLCLEGVVRNVANRVNGIYIITPDVTKLDKGVLLRFPGVEVMDEREVMGFGAKELRRLLPDMKSNRVGWIFQQLLKLSGKIGTEDHVLFIDSDHILLRPHTFIDKDGKTVFYRSAEAYYPYYDNISRLTGRFPFSRFSYVAHKMLFSKDHLNWIRQELGGEEMGVSGFAKWIEKICGSLDWNLTDMPFSEFELYGNTFPSEKKRFVLWRQKTLSGTDGGKEMADLVRMYGDKHLSVTYPSYLKD